MSANQVRRTPMVRCLVVDDSALMRQFIRRSLAERGIQVVGVARNGEEAVSGVLHLLPDVVTLDVNMPVLDGLAALRQIMASRPTPVVMVSQLTAREAPASIEALASGAVDVVAKPEASTRDPSALARFADELARKVRIAARARPRPVSSGPQAFAPPKPQKPFKSPAASADPRVRPPLVVIGSSTGGPAALCELFASLDPVLLPSPVIVVQHMPAGFTRSLAERLDSLSPLHVREAENGAALRPGEVLVAPGGFHLLVRSGGLSVSLDDSPPRQHVRPSVDVTLESAARHYPGPVVAVILTGMGSDGALGARLVRARGGRVIVQDESTSAIYGMPRAVVEQGDADLVCPLPEIATALVQTVTMLNYSVRGNHE